jgi:hypothetical protein
MHLETAGQKLQKWFLGGNNKPFVNVAADIPFYSILMKYLPQM